MAGHQIKVMSRMMRTQRMKNCEETASMDRSGTKVRWVRAGQMPVLGGASWESLGPEATGTKRTWSEILGWDDGFEPADTTMRAAGLA